MESTNPLSRLLLIVLIIGLGVLAYVNYSKRIQVAKELQRLSVKLEQLQGGNSPESVEQAKKIVAKVKKHIWIPDGVDPTVATIVDVNTLRARNEFYKNAENGDFLVVTTTRAILYDPDKDIVLDVVPVALQPQQPAPAQPGQPASSAPAAPASSAPKKK